MHQTKGGQTMVWVVDEDQKGGEKEGVHWSLDKSANGENYKLF